MNLKDIIITQNNTILRNKCAKKIQKDDLIKIKSRNKKKRNQLLQQYLFHFPWLII